MKASFLLLIGLQSLLIFADTREVGWTAGIPLALGSASGAYIAAKLAYQEWGRV
jgi:uncharacterized membrane protein YfcA